MGELFLAEDTEWSGSVALKVISIEVAKDLNQRKRFRAEAKAASGLAPSNICAIHEVGQTERGCRAKLSPAQTIKVNVF